MLYLAFIFHMHQPYYKNLLTQEISLPWVRLHGSKDYLDMLKVLEAYPLIKQTFNLVPSLIEQVEDYAQGRVKDKFLELSLKKASLLTPQEKDFILKNFFMINKERVISIFPRYYELFIKNGKNTEFSQQDFLDLQVLFNLAWIDPLFRLNSLELNNLVRKARFFSEEDKPIVINKQLDLLKDMVSAYKKFMKSQQVELTVSPYYHPILPLLCNTKTALEANPRSTLPAQNFSYPDDAEAQIESAVRFYQERFDALPYGMWPSEEAVSEQILPFIIKAGISWIVADEAILFKSLKKKKRDTFALYQPYLLKRKGGALNIVFRDRNLSDLIGFTYHNWKAESAADDFMKHLENIHTVFKAKDLLVTVALDGENAWEFYPNDGHDFLKCLYQRISDSKIIKTTTVNSYLKKIPPRFEIKRLASGSWIYAEFSKWINNPYKNKAWEYLLQARQELQEFSSRDKRSTKLSLAWKQIYILEGSDWFWWYGEDPEGDFDRLFRMHLANFYRIIDRDIPSYLEKPITT